jgi:glycine/D-amino acid oxidase-like deaminating enzyme
VNVIVIGGGFAGVAAAFAARRGGAGVTVVQHGSGASALYSGAVDGPLAPSGDAAELGELAARLGLRLGAATIVATREGVVRRASGRDSALLDLAPLAGKRVGLVDVPRDDWDGPLLLRAFASSPWAVSTGTRFELVPLELLEKSHQRRVSPFDFALGFERAERPAWLRQILKAHAGPDGWLFGPWLGVRQDLARQLTESAGVPVGEVTSPPGGVAGARFDARRDALLAALSVEIVAARVLSVSVADSGVGVELEGGQRLGADALVVACGGIVSGAIRMTGALSGAPAAGFELAISGLPPLEVHGQQAGAVSSLFGVDLAARGRQVLERVRLPRGRGSGVLGAARVFACGDVTAPEPPSVGDALVGGLAAGRAALLGN